MSIIQQIREKAAWLVFGLIALSLVGFLLMDAFVGKSRLFGSNQTTVGSVNGEALDYVKYSQESQLRENQYKSMGYPVNESTQDNIKEQIWNQFVEDAVMTDIYSDLGLQVGDKELNDLLVGENAAPEIKQSFTDPKTGFFDQDKASQTINQLRTVYRGAKQNDQNYTLAKNFFENEVPRLIKQRQRDKYTAMLSKSAYVPKWMAEKINSDNSQVASISYVKAPYTIISDSTIKISDDEIKTYVDAHQEEFKQEESRSIAYVTFNAGPSAADSASVREKLESLKAEFASTAAANVKNFLAREGSDQQYYESKVTYKNMQQRNKDSLVNIPVGSVYGPYLDANTYVLAKMVDKQQWPDTVKVRHILIGTVQQDPQTRQYVPIRADSTAKRIADSISNAIRNGTNFDSLVAKFSDDQGSKDKGGVYDNVPTGQMVPPFNDYIFTHKPGDKGIVKTDFGYHYIEILSQKGGSQAVQIAYLAKSIVTSDATENSVSGLANQFAGQSRSQKAFEDNIEKQKLQKLLAQDILPQQGNIQGLGSSRTLVKWLYESSVGDVSEPYVIGDKYIVAMVTEINKKGPMSAAKARISVEPILRNQKKSEMLVKKIGNANTLEAIGTATAEPVSKADSINFSSPYIPNVGQEAKVIGAAFNKSLAGKPASEPIPGNGGVFVIRVENVGAKPNYNGDITMIQKTQEQKIGNLANEAIGVYKKTATIKDNRAKFF